MTAALKLWRWIKRVYARLVLRRIPHRTATLGISFGGAMNLSSISMNVRDTVVITPIPLESDGATQTPGATVSVYSWASSDTSLASITANSDGTATLTALAPGTVTPLLSATVTDPGGSPVAFNATGASISISAASVAPAPAAVTASLGLSYGAVTPA